MVYPPGASPQWASRKGSTRERGYGADHLRARREALAAFRPGDPCSRCGGPMIEGQAIHLDHTDDRCGYRGLAHASCNCRHGASVANSKPRRSKPCLTCGSTFTPRAAHGRYCSPICRRVAELNRRAARHAVAA